MDRIGIIAFSVLGAAIWVACFFASANARIKRSEKDGTKPKLAACRIFYIVTGILGQVFYWGMIYDLSQWGGMD